MIVIIVKESECDIKMNYDAGNKWRHNAQLNDIKHFNTEHYNI